MTVFQMKPHPSRAIQLPNPLLWGVQRSTFFLQSFLKALWDATEDEAEVYVSAAKASALANRPESLKRDKVRRFQRLCKLVKQRDGNLNAVAALLGDDEAAAALSSPLLEAISNQDSEMLVRSTSPQPRDFPSLSDDS
jgi:hypothetical protein